LTYDATYRWPDGRMGAILVSAPPGFDSRLPASNVPIYAVDPVTASSVLLTSVNGASGNGVVGGSNSCVVEADNPSPSTPRACGDASFFSFDLFRQGIWSYGTLPGGGGINDPHPGFLSLDGSFANNCFSTFYHQDQYGNYYDSAALVAAAVVGGNGYLYVALEDDTTVWKIDERDCSTVGGFSHQSLGENTNEEEQMACDPLTLGAPVLWVRNGVVNGQQNQVSAYPASDAYCPFPTRLTYNGPTLVKPGAPAQLCFTLSGALAGQWQSLNGQPITVQIGGATAGRAVTDSSGRACLATSAPVAPGAVAVQGTFAGTQAFLPSSVDGTLLVLPTGSGQQVSGAGLPPTTLGGLPAPQLATGQQPNSAPGTEPVASVSTQVQAQAQAQSASQVQPGVMVQRQKRTQIAIQQQGTATNAAYEARALRHARPAPGAAVAAGLMMLGLGLAGRRPRWALAWLPGRSRGRRR
jgi:hypothetical protein